MAKNAKLPVQKLKAAKAVPVRVVNDSCEVPKADSTRERKWKAEDALRDIQRAEAHKSDKTLMSDVKKLAKEQVDNLKKFC